MAHAAQELTLQTVGFLHFLVAKLQFTILIRQLFGVADLHRSKLFLGVAAFTYVANDRGHSEPFLQMHGAQADLHWNPGPSFLWADSCNPVPMGRVAGLAQ